MSLDQSSNRLATTSLTLGIVGWVIYSLQWCFDFSVGLVLAVATGGSSAVCGTVLDVLPFLLWILGIICGHVSLARIKHAGGPGRGQTYWGLFLNYLGLFFTILLVVFIVILIITGAHAGWLTRVLPFIHK